MALFDSLAKLLGEGYHVVQLVFFRNFFGLLFVLLLVYAVGVGGMVLIPAHRPHAVEAPGRFKMVLAALRGS